MPALISNLLAWFGGGGLLNKFFAFIGKAFGFSVGLLTIQFTILGLLLVAKFSFITALVTLLMWVYNKLDDILLQIVTLQSNDSFSLVFEFLRAIGFIQALNESFSTFTYVFVSFLALFIAKLSYHSLKDISDEYYKIGMLLAVGVNK